MYSTNNEQFTDEDLERILKQAEKVEFERLQQKTVIPTVFIKELLDSPANWLLSKTFFDVDIKDKDKRSLIHELIEQLQRISLTQNKELLLEQNYEVDFYQEDPIMYQGFFVHIRVYHRGLYLKSIELNCLDFRGLCECINLKAYAQLYFENSQYEVSFYCMRLASYVFGAATNEIRGETDFQQKLSNINSQKSLEYWQPKNQEKEQRKKRYLKVMTDMGFTKYTDAAKHIHKDDNIEDRDYRQIYDELREADKDKRTT